MLGKFCNFQVTLGSLDDTFWQRARSWFVLFLHLGIQDFPILPWSAACWSFRTLRTQLKTESKLSQWFQVCIIEGFPRILALAELVFSYVTRNEKREMKRETRTVRETGLRGFAYKKRGERKIAKLKVPRIVMNKFRNSDIMNKSSTFRNLLLQIIHNWCWFWTVLLR